MSRVSTCGSQPAVLNREVTNGVAYARTERDVDTRHIERDTSVHRCHVPQQCTCAHAGTTHSGTTCLLQSCRQLCVFVTKAL